MEGDREAGRAKSVAALERSSADPVAPNPRAAAVWWTGSLFGTQAAGGKDALRKAQQALERNGWRQSLREPELVGSSG